MVKKPANPRAEELKRARLQLTEACKEKAVDRVLEIFHECELSKLMLPPSFLAQALSGFAPANEHASDSCRSETAQSEHFGHARQIFERARSSIANWGSHGESIYTLMVRLASRAREFDIAMQYLREMTHPPVSMRPKLRTFVPILETCANAGLTDEAEGLYSNDLLPACGAVEAAPLWSSEEEERLWQIIFSLRVRAWSAAAKMGKVIDHSGLTAILQDMASVCPQLCDIAIADALQEAFEVLKWCTKTGVCISADGVCPVTSKTLQAFRPCDSDLRHLLNLIERLAIENASQRVLDGWTQFKTWLGAASNDWDTVIDGANVGHANQNFDCGAFSHQQIDALVAQCVKAGRRKPAVVLRRHWLLPDTDLALPPVKKKRRQLPQLGLLQDKAGESELSAPPVAEETPALSSLDGEIEIPFDTDELPEEQRRIVEIVQRWKSHGVLVVSPPSINDDWVALYIAVAMCLRGVPDVQFISNDELRDHFWRMRQPQAFQVWRERHATRYEIFSKRPLAGEQPSEDTEMSVQLFPPSVYTHRAQQSLDGKSWHFPVRLKMGVQEVGSREVKESSQQLEWLVAFVPSERQT